MNYAWSTLSPSNQKPNNSETVILVAHREPLICHYFFLFISGWTWRRILAKLSLHVPKSGNVSFPSHLHRYWQGVDKLYFVVFCYGSWMVNFSISYQGYFTGNGTMELLPQCPFRFTRLYSHKPLITLLRHFIIVLYIQIANTDLVTLFMNKLCLS